MELNRIIFIFISITVLINCNSNIISFKNGMTLKEIHNQIQSFFCQDVYKNEDIDKFWNSKVLYTNWPTAYAFEKLRERVCDDKFKDPEKVPKYLVQLFFKSQFEFTWPKSSSNYPEILIEKAADTIYKCANPWSNEFQQGQPVLDILNKVVSDILTAELVLVPSLFDPANHTTPVEQMITCFEGEYEFDSRTQRMRPVIFDLAYDVGLFVFGLRYRMCPNGTLLHTVRDKKECHKKKATAFDERIKDNIWCCKQIMKKCPPWFDADPEQMYCSHHKKCKNGRHCIFGLCCRENYFEPGEFPIITKHSCNTSKSLRPHTFCDQTLGKVVIIGAFSQDGRFLMEDLRNDDFLAKCDKKIWPHGQCGKDGVCVKMPNDREQCYLNPLLMYKTRRSWIDFRRGTIVLFTIFASAAFICLILQILYLGNIRRALLEMYPIQVDTNN